MPELQDIFAQHAEAYQMGHRPSPDQHKVQDLSTLTRVAVDETSARRGHKYVTPSVE